MRVLVADVDTGGHLRGYVGFKADQVETLPDSASVARMFGGGYLAFTVERTEGEGRYQGIVALEGETLAESVHHYFRQSEQIPTGLRLACEKGEDGKWRGAALLIQRVPETGGEAVAGGSVDAFRPPPETWEEDEGYMRAMALLATATSDEMLAESSTPEDLLFKLFHEDGIRIFDPSSITGECACPPNKFHDLLARLPRSEVEDCKVDGVIDVTCEFCGKTEHFDDAAIEALFNEAPA
jgi:molecular chaperone Hsp33